jgi:two-component system response regulator RegA
MPDRLSIPAGPPAPAATALVVDPDERARGEMADWLRAAGYATREAQAFEEARRVLLAPKAPDVLVVELRLGAFNGLHLIISARAAHPNLRAVLTTRADDVAVGVEARQADSAYLPKPLRRAAFLAAVAHGHGTPPGALDGAGA